MIGVATKDEKVRLLREAVKKHTRLASEAIIGEGVDRHMLGSLLSCPSDLSTNFVSFARSSPLQATLLACTTIVHGPTLYPLLSLDTIHQCRFQ